MPNLGSSLFPGRGDSWTTFYYRQGKTMIEAQMRIEARQPWRKQWTLITLDARTCIVHEKNLSLGIVQCVQELYRIRLERGGMRPPTRNASTQVDMSETQPYTHGQHICWIILSHSPDLRLPVIVNEHAAVAYLKSAVAEKLGEQPISTRTQLATT